MVAGAMQFVWQLRLMVLLQLWKIAICSCISFDYIFHKLCINIRKRLNGGTVPPFKMHPGGTVPLYKMHPGGTLPPFELHPRGTVPLFKMHPGETLNFNELFF